MSEAVVSFGFFLAFAGLVTLIGTGTHRDFLAFFRDRKVAKLKSKCARLLAENKSLRELARSGGDQEQRLRVLETIVTDGELDFERKLLESERSED